MSQLKGILFALLIVSLAALPAQAAKYNINNKALKEVKKAAIISISLTNIADNNEHGINRNSRLDLNDPNGTAISAYKGLIDSTAEKMLKKLIKKLP